MKRESPFLMQRLHVIKLLISCFYPSVSYQAGFFARTQGELFIPSILHQFIPSVRHRTPLGYMSSPNHTCMLKIIKQYCLMVPLNCYQVFQSHRIYQALCLPLEGSEKPSDILLSFSSPHTQSSFLHLAEFLIPFTPLGEKGKQLSQGEKKIFLLFHLQADESIKYEDKSAPSSGQIRMSTSRYFLLY